MEFWLGGALGSEGSLVWLSPGWQVALGSSLALLLWFLATRGQRSPRARLGELVLWALALIGLVVALARPIWVEEEGRKEAGRLAVLVDGSRSMGVLQDGAPRHAAVESILDHVRRNAERVDVYHFDQDLSVGPPSEFDGSGTDLERALVSLSERVAGERLAGVVVISDGLDRGLLRRRFASDGVEATAPGLPGPLTVYQVGDVGQLRDLSVRSVDSGGYAFIRSPFTISADIRGIGFEDTSVEVTLEQNGSPVTTRSVQLDEEGRGEVQFEVRPDAAGRFAYSVQVPQYEGDAVPENNALPVVVGVVRDRIRVLQVAGAPSWDVKFLRRFLKGDPSVQLVSFFILRTQEDMGSGYSDRELSLIAFPYDQLFDEDISTFDAVIFQNFDYAPYLKRRSGDLLENLASYVRGGGGLIMIGGDRSFSLGDYGRSPLADVLPVQVSPVPVPPDTRKFRPSLTAAGSMHPVTSLVADAAENTLWWERLRELDGTNAIEGAHPDATVLLEHPALRGINGQPLPVLAAREVGEGRTLSLSVDSSWRWSLSEAAEGRGNQAYLRFWKNALRWLMRDPALSRVTVETSRENYAEGDEVRVVVRVRDLDFAPLADADVQLRVLVQGEEQTYEGETTSDGDVVFVVPGEVRGTHQVAVSATVQGKPVGEAQTVFAVTNRDPELDEVAPDVQFLQWLAGRTGGTYFSEGEIGDPLLDPDSGRTVWERSEAQLWRSPLLMTWILVFSGLAWWVRRRAGLS